MKVFEIRILLTIAFFLLMILSGIWLSRKGKPYNLILFNIHKMISLGAILMTTLALLFYSRDYALSSINITLIICTAILFIILLLTGGLLNIKKEMPRFVLITHRITPLIVSVLAFLSIYILIQN